MNITATEVYWIMKMDQVVSPLFVVNVFSFLIVLGLGLFVWVTSNDGELENARKRAYKIFITSLVVFLVTLPLCIFLPSTKQLAAMRIIPAITNSEFTEKLSKAGEELYMLATEAIKENLEK